MFLPRISRFQLIAIFVLVSSFCRYVVLASDTHSQCESSSLDGECKNPDANKVRLVTREELATKTGKDGQEIWLSIMGEVYDVTLGKDHYGPGASYGNFAGRDASVPFCTGKFTPEEAEKSTDVLKSSELPGLADWRDFYRKHKVYKFVGKLVDPRFYDEFGEPTLPMIEFQERIQIARAEHELKAKQRREERLKKQKTGFSKKDQ